MRCVELSPAFGLENLHIVERPTPEPGPGQVRVRMRACSLNYRDFLMVTGAYNPRQALPLVPLSDGAGVIDAVGTGVSLPVGARVAGCFAPMWLDGEPTHERIRATLGGPLDGMLAESVLLPASGVVEVPAHLSDVQAATLPCAGVTAWNALVELAKIKAGDTVLVQGSGGVSLFALQFAKMHGAQVIATSSSDDRLEKMRALGATHTINYAREKDWGKAAKKLTGGVGVDVVVEVGGAGTLEQSLKAVRIGGSICLIGMLAGAKTDLPLTSIFMQAITVYGTLVGSRAHFVAMNRAITQAQMVPVVGETFALAETRKAFEAISRGGHYGKLCVVPDSVA